MEGIPSDLSCCVCIKVYEYARPPIFLPGCGHSMCCLCILNQTKSSGNAFSCPSCRYLHRGMDVNNLKVNYSLLHIVQQLSTKPSMKKLNSSPVAQSEEAGEISEKLEHLSNPFADQLIYHLEWRIRCVASDTQLNEDQILHLINPSNSNTETQTLDQTTYRLEWRVRCVTPDSQLNQENTSTLSTLASSSISEDLLCSVCTEMYDYSRLPICLPGCGHSFCFFCLLDLTKHSGNTFPCPSCRYVHRGMVVDNLNVNYALLNVAQQLNQRPSMKNQISLHFAQSEEVKGISEIHEHSFTPYSGQPKYRLEWRVRCVNSDHELDQKKDTSSNIGEKKLEQPKYQLEWRVRHVSSDIQLNQGQISRSITPPRSRSEEESFSRGSNVNQSKIKKMIKKMLSKSISFVTDVIS